MRMRRRLTRIARRRRGSKPHDDQKLLRDLRAERRDLKRQLEATRRERDLLVLAQQQAQPRASTWQNQWSRQDCSTAVTFLSENYVYSESYHGGGNSMPGVHTVDPIRRGQVIQSIWVKGRGYTLAGLVATEEQKIHLRRHAGSDWRAIGSLMEHVDAGENCMVTLDINMNTRQAKLLVYNSPESREASEVKAWTDLPDEVWIALSFKRNGAREAILVPCVQLDE